MRNPQAVGIPGGYIVWDEYSSTLAVHMAENRILVGFEDLDHIITALQNIRDANDKQHELWLEKNCVDMEPLNTDSIYSRTKGTTP